MFRPDGTGEWREIAGASKANLIGATPTGRREDDEVHPLDKSVYIAFTAAATAPGHLF